MYCVVPVDSTSVVSAASHNVEYRAQLREGSSLPTAAQGSSQAPQGVAGHSDYVSL